MKKRWTTGRKELDQQIDDLFAQANGGKHLAELDQQLEALFDGRRTPEGVEAAVDDADALVTEWMDRWIAPPRGEADLQACVQFRERYHEKALTLARRARARIAEEAVGTDRKAKKVDDGKKPDKGPNGTSSDKKDPSAAETRAWQSYEWVATEHPELMPKNGERHYTRQMHKAAMKSPHYVDEATGKRIANPSFDSWKRNLRGYIQKCPKINDTRCELRPEETATEDNIEDLSDVTSRLPREN